MATLKQDRLLFLLNIPLRWRHTQFWTTGQLTCQNATPEVAKETGDQNTMRVEREKFSQAATYTTCLLYHMNKGNLHSPVGKHQNVSFEHKQKPNTADLYLL